VPDFVEQRGQINRFLKGGLETHEREELCLSASEAVQAGEDDTFEHIRPDVDQLESETVFFGCGFQTQALREEQEDVSS
jgi:hypothetical protein